MSKPHQRREIRSMSEKPHPNFHTARAGAKKHPPTRAGPKYAAQAYLPTHQTKGKSKHRRVQQRSNKS